MRAPTLLVALALAAPLHAAPPDAESTPLASTAPAGTTPLPAGVRVDADLREEYLAGFSMLVAVTVTNDTSAAVRLPDLYSRPHLVHFLLDGPRGRSERYATPPASDSNAEWSVPAGGSRRALIEVPSSAGFVAGAWTLGVRLALPTGNVDLPSRSVVIRPAAPAGGQFVWEPTIAANVGAMMPWVHRAARGFDLYLLQSRAKAPGDVVAQYHLAHLEAAADPVLSRARTADAQSRHVYWSAGAHELTVARLNGAALQAPPRTVSLPWPKVELLGRGVTDTRGGLTIPVWIPAPTGSAGELRAVRIDERGALSYRKVANASRRPTTVATAVDAASNLLLALTDENGVVLYQVDAAAAPELPARGARVWKRDGDWGTRLLTFDTLPDTTSHAGGLALLCVLTPSTPGQSSRLLWSDISGAVFSDTQAPAWTLPGEVVSVLPSGYGPLYVQTRDTAGLAWYALLGGPPQRTSTPGTLWSTEEAVILRSTAAGTVFLDETLGPRAP